MVCKKQQGGPYRTYLFITDMLSD